MAYCEVCGTLCGTKHEGSTRNNFIAQSEGRHKYLCDKCWEEEQKRIAAAWAMRGIAEAEGQLADISRFLEDSKVAYRKAEASGHWPVTIGGFAMSKERAQAKIVEVAERRPLLRGVIARNKNMITSLDRKARRISEEQQKVVRIKDRTQLTLDGLRLKKIIGGDSDIVNALNAINDALGSIGIDYDDPSVEELVISDKNAEIKEAFDDIMSDK